MKYTVDFLIIGQGIAGTVLSYQLINKGYSVKVIDDNHETSSTKVAAGLINPLVLKRLTKTWRAEEFIPFNASFYQSLEKAIGASFVIDKTILKLISSEDEELFWKKRSNIEGINNYITSELEDLTKYEFLHANTFKGGAVKDTGWIDTEILLTAYKKFLINKNILHYEQVDYTEIKVSETDVKYKDIVAKEIIFCDGYQSYKSPFFNWIPLSMVKGELLIIESDALNDEYIFNKKIFILPIGDNKYKIGATYNWKDLSLVPTENKRIELLKNLEELINCNYRVVDHIVGIRPAVKDRRPLNGRHPKFSNVHLFNGMGSRGLFMAPKLGEEFVNYLENKGKIHPEVDLERYYSCY